MVIYCTQARLIFSATEEERTNDRYSLVVFMVCCAVFYRIRFYYYLLSQSIAFSLYFAFRPNRIEAVLTLSVAGLTLIQVTPRQSAAFTMVCAPAS